MKSRQTAVAVAMAAALVVSGCTQDSSQSQPSGPTATRSATVSVEPTPAATHAPTRPDLSDLVLTTEGIGYLVFDQPVPVVDPAEAIITYDPDGCGIGYGTWLTTYDDSSQDVLVVLTEQSAESGAVQWVLVESAEIGTDRGIHVGDSREELLATYPEAEKYTLTRADMELFVVRGTRGMLLFEFSVNNAEYPIGELLWLRAIANSVPPEGIYAIANTGAGGACFA